MKHYGDVSKKYARLLRTIWNFIFKDIKELKKVSETNESEVEQ